MEIDMIHFAREAARIRWPERREPRAQKQRHFPVVPHRVVKAIEE
jgi:hypothetical protein